MVEVLLDPAAVLWSPCAVKTIPCSAGATAVVGSRISLPERCQYRVSVRRVGGTANTLVAIRSWQRQIMPQFQRNNDPVELLYHQQNGIECWGTGGGAHAHPAAGPAYAPEPAAAADQLRIPVGEANTLVITYAVAANAATTIEFVVQESRDQGATFQPRQAVNSVVAGVVNQTVALESVTGAIGTFETREISITPGTTIRIDAQRTGGGAGTELLAYARLYRREG
jgi:hypothetical protein